MRVVLPTSTACFGAPARAESPGEIISVSKGRASCPRKWKPQAESMRASPMRISSRMLSDHDIDEAPWHHDDFLHNLIAHKFPDLLASRLLDGFPCGILAHFHASPQLSIDLDDVFDLVRDQRKRIQLGPGLVEYGRPPLEPS